MGLRVNTHHQIHGRVDFLSCFLSDILKVVYFKFVYNFEWILVEAVKVLSTLYGFQFIVP